MNLRDLTHNDPAVIDKFGDCDRDLVIGFLELRHKRGKANYSIAMRAVFRQLDRCPTTEDKEITLENAICDNAHSIYDRHLPDSSRYAKPATGTLAQAAKELEARHEYH